MMKNITLPFLFLSLFSFVSLFGQERLEHPSRFYKAEDGKLYANKNAPMYLFIGGSPNSTEDLYRLESERTPKFANPFYFDTEGFNSIRTPSQVDTVTKQIVYPLADIIFDVYADGIKPVTKASFNSSNRFEKSAKVFYNNGLTIHLIASDKMSGVQNSYFSINTHPFTEYIDTLRFDEEGEYQLSFYSVDNVGNVEEVQTYQFIIDATPPVANWSLDGNVHGMAASGESKIIILAKDNQSGLKKISYQINDQPIRIYKDGISFNDMPSGEYKLRYWAEDNVGNIYEGNDVGTSVFAFIVDKTPPTASNFVVGDQFLGDLLYVSPSSKCELAAHDTISGIRNIIYGYSQRFMSEIYEEPFHFEDKHGLQTVWFQAFDLVANSSVIEKLTVFMDNEPPITRVEYEGPQFFTRDTLFISKETSIQLISEDVEAGVERVQYNINNGDFQNGNKFKLVNAGFHSVGFKATDKVQNKEQLKYCEVLVDDEGPEIYINFSIKPLRQDVVNGEEVNIYPPYVKIYIGATDRYCGTQDIFYTIDGGEKFRYGGSNSPAGSEIFKDEKLYEVDLEATDKLGNVSFKKLKFVVAKK